MSVIAETPPTSVRGRRRTTRTPKSALFWRLFGFNALVFLAAAAVLLLSPATVSTHASLAEIGVVTLGSALMLAVNALLLRMTLRPLDGPTALMERVDLLRPGARMSVQGDRDVAQLIKTFNEMLDLLEHERACTGGSGIGTATHRQGVARRDRTKPDGRAARPETHHRPRSRRSP
jgi:two-component system sensor histidine kinase UhpB